MDLLRWMHQWDMLPEEGGVVLCAVSGGRDSMCLLHYLHSIAPACGFTVAAGHFNHQMRPEADADEQFVRTFCAERSIPFYTAAAPVYERAEAWNLSVEETGRRLRSEFLSRTGSQIGASRIATAHHALDNAETVLLNLLRGTGTEGLGGIPPVRGKFIRPLLQTSRQEIDAYCAAHNIPFVEDSTNGDTHYARNRLRLELWPQLETINSNLTAALGRTAAIVRAENGYLDTLAGEKLPAEGTAVPLDTLRQAPEVLRRRMLRLLLHRLPTGKKDVSAAHVAAMLDLVEKGRGTLTLPDGARIRCQEGAMTFSVAQAAPPEQELHKGENHWGDFTITLSGEVEGLTVRPWRRNDRMAMEKGSRSLKRIFSDHGITPLQRETLPVVCLNGEVCGVYLNENGCTLTLSADGGKINITITRENSQEDRDNG